MHRNWDLEGQVQDRETVSSWRPPTGSTADTGEGGDRPGQTGPALRVSPGEAAWLSRGGDLPGSAQVADLLAQTAGGRKGGTNMGTCPRLMSLEVRRSGEGETTQAQTHPV